MIHIRPEQDKDYEKITKVNIEAFGQVNEAELVETLRMSEDFIPELSLVAIRDGEVVGHILFSPVEIETPDGYVPVLTLAPMAVLPAFQNQVIGSKLVKRGLEECKRLGYKIVVVIGHPNYYPRFGFVSASEKGLKASLKDPKEAFMVIELELGALEGVRGIVRFPKAFSNV